MSDEKLPSKEDYLSGKDEKPAKPEVLEFTHREVGDLKKKWREEGASKAQQKAAKDNGFESYEEMLSWIKGTKQASAKQSVLEQEDEPEAPEPPKRSAQPKTQASAPAPAKKPAASSTAQELKEEREDELAKLKHAFKDSEITKKELERKIEEISTIYEVKLLALRHGVKEDEIDYAADLFFRETEDLSEEDFKTYDETKFFQETLREKKPYLYKDGVKEEPATTGSGAKATSAPDAKTAASSQAKGAEKKKVKDMTDAEYKEYMQKNYPGLDPNRVSNIR